jgi:endo-1,4-beta-D-glucanase Y
MATRLDMYNPMYYLSSYYQGYKTSSVAPYWRIRTGINQGDTALTTETNLSLALGQYSGVKNVDFATVWAQAHTMAERTGDSTTNFI